MTTAAELRSLAFPVDPTAYDLEDAAGTVGGAARRWRWTVEGLEEIPHGALVALEAMADALRAAGGSGDDLPSLAAGVEAELRRLGAEHGARSRLVDVLGEHHPLPTATEMVDRMLSGAGRQVAEQNVSPQVGVLERINVSGGGAPKSAVGSAVVGPRGLEGDRQATRRHHGRPFQAVCLFSGEVIAELAAEGHPISAGSVGENLTVSGLHWEALRPGVRLAVGDLGGPGDLGGRGDPAEAPVVLELTAWVPPCSNISASFSDGRWAHVDHDEHPGRGRAYAWVVQSGRLHSGAPVTVLP